MKLSEAAHRVIDLARRVREYYDAELPKWHPNYPLVGSDEEDPPPPAEEQELRVFLANLSDELVYQLTLIMDLGREDFDKSDLAGYYENLKDTFGGPEPLVSQMMGQAPLADYLADGLEELRKHNINVDRMPLRKPKVRKK